MAVPLSRMTSAPMFEHTSESEATAPCNFESDVESDESEDCVSTTPSVIAVAMTTTTTIAKAMTLFETMVVLGSTYYSTHKTNKTKDTVRTTRRLKLIKQKIRNMERYI
jgi:hypothetical protein